MRGRKSDKKVDDDDDDAAKKRRGLWVCARKRQATPARQKRELRGFSWDAGTAKALVETGLRVARKWRRGGGKVGGAFLFFALSEAKMSRADEKRTQ